jgi:hypothetical protein
MKMDASNLAEKTFDYRVDYELIFSSGFREKDTHIGWVLLNRRPTRGDIRAAVGRDVCLGLDETGMNVVEVRLTSEPQIKVRRSLKAKKDRAGFRRKGASPRTSRSSPLNTNELISVRKP